ncbi:hypothetical protein EYB45_00315 [Erythrobacteraceae bacterium CFH 75059]|uniref:hypothetical protein n=1 Tax=Qipengyuania thermophila TaxID=2509361 RepID=UPI0010221D56|nr:hypothetical protein [Qipengyuania thermophila]TCD06226.1 hypothetical protein EYB45_00315 [Erythrobacteraceae bacterium CFH 75059]
MTRSCRVLLAAWAAVLALPAAAQEGRSASAEPPAPLRAVVDCRSLPADAERLACYDRTVAALEEERREGRIAVTSIEEVRAARRSLFGLPLGGVRLFPGVRDGGADEEPESVTGTIRAVQTTRSGNWLVQIDDAVWQTTESGYFQTLPRVGQEATVTRGLLGSYRLSVAGRPGLRAVRVR